MLSIPENFSTRVQQRVHELGSLVEATKSRTAQALDELIKRLRVDMNLCIDNDRWLGTF